MKWHIASWLCLAVLATAAQTRPSDSGLYAIWYRDKYELLDVPYIVGGQIVVQWHDVAPAADRYDFSAIGQELVYHQQITEGNLLPNLDACWDEIAYIQTGDNPGRKEPGTGEINYRNVFQHLAKKGYKGVIGMEHGNAKPGAEGEQAVIDAYRAADSYPR